MNQSNHNRPLLSLCIPTDGNVHWVLPVLDSIYTQEVNTNLFEVIVTDNGNSSELAEVIKLYNYPNLKYFKSESKGFTNIIFSLQQANGVFRKMINHRSRILPGKLQEMIELVHKYDNTRPIMYFSDNQISKEQDVIECKNYDELIYNLNYWISWSAGIGIWEDDVPKLEEIKYDETFPNIAVVLDVRKDSHCVIWNKKYQDMLDDSGKGGYNLFNAFAVILLNLLGDYTQEKKISEKTYQATKDKLFRFLTQLYLEEVIRKSKHSYDLSNIYESMCTHYSYKKYIWMKIIGMGKYVKSGVKKRIGRFFSKIR